MAEDQQEPALEPEGEALPAEVIETEAEPTEPDPVEALAAEIGWSPKDQWRGDPEAWRPADEFIRSGRDITKSLTGKLKGMETEIQRMSRVSSQLLEDKLAERDTYWRNQHARAVEDGDSEAATRAVDEMRKLDGQRASGPPPQVAEWQQRNPWFNTDPLAADRAREIAGRLAQQGIGVEEQLAQAERAIRREFPEHFPAPTKQPAAVQTTQSRKAAPSNRQKGFNDMPEESRKMAVDYEKRHGVKREDFAARYWADNGRKVG